MKQAAIEDNVDVSRTTKNGVPMRYSSPTSEDISKRTEKVTTPVFTTALLTSASVRHQPSGSRVKCA